MACSSSIVSLNTPCVPHTIVWFVIAVVVFPFKSMRSTWARSHVSEEQDKIVPAFTNFDAASTIIWKTGVVWVSTSRKHSSPNIVFWNTVRLSVSARSFSCAFRVKASARLSASVTKIATGCECLLSTIAKAIPRLFIDIIGKRDQATETLICDINEFWHSIILAHP